MCMNLCKQTPGRITKHSVFAELVLNLEYIILLLLLLDKSSWLRGKFLLANTVTKYQGCDLDVVRQFLPESDLPYILLDYMIYRMF